MYYDDKHSVVAFRGIEIHKDAGRTGASQTSLWLRGILMTLALFSVVVMAVFFGGR